MGNEFDVANYPETEPAKLVAGDRWAWKRVDLGSDYPPALYDLTYSARLEGVAPTAEIAITASESGSDYVVEVPSATTAGYGDGIYHWQAYITRTADSERVTVDSGTFEVAPDRDDSTADPRSDTKIMLDAVIAVLKNRATKDQESYTINGRSLSRTPLADLLEMKKQLQAEYNQELQKEAIENGQGTSSRVLVRF